MPPSAPAKKFTLSDVRKDLKPLSDIIIVHGPGGVGKTTFAAGFPAPFFVPVEDGVRYLRPVPDCGPPIDTFDDIAATLEMLLNENHGYKTVVIDSIDEAERLLKAKICREANKDSEWFEAFGQGYRMCPDHWRRVILLLTRLIREKGMSFVGLAHSRTRTFKNPEGADWPRWEISLTGDVQNPTGGAGIWKHWADAVLFANFESIVVTNPNDKDPAALKKGKGMSTGKRLLYTNWNAAYDAKNRYGLPDSIALDYAEYAAAKASGAPAPAVDLYAEAVELLGKVDKDTKAKAGPMVEANKNDPQRLAIVVNKLRSKVV